MYTVYVLSGTLWVKTSEELQRVLTKSSATQRSRRTYDADKRSIVYTTHQSDVHTDCDNHETLILFPRWNDKGQRLKGVKMRVDEEREPTETETSRSVEALVIWLT